MIFPVVTNIKYSNQLLFYVNYQYGYIYFVNKAGAT